MLKKITAYFFTEFNYKQQSLNFKRLLYLFIVFKIVYWLCYYGLFFGNNSITFSRPYELGPIKDLAFFLYGDAAPNFGYFFIIGALVFVCLSYFLKKIPFIFEFILWFFVVNIHNKIYPTITGGELLVNQFLFFNCFLSKTYLQNNKWQNDLAKAVHNFGIIAFLIQIQLVYLIAAIAKLNSNDWLNGTALNDLGLIEHLNLYSGPVIKNTTINWLMNYIVLFYQLLFSLLIWIQKIKKPLIILGIFMHLYIAFVTGLVGFGIIMIIAYTFFWPLKKQTV